MKKIYLLLLLCCLTAIAKAQTAASYVFSQTTGTYTALSSATTAFSGSWDDNTTTVPLGFTFNYCGTNYTNVSIVANGFLTFSSSLPTYWESGAIDMRTKVIAGMANDLYYMWTSSSSNVSYKTTGTAPNRVFTVQWSDATIYSDPADGPLNFQIQLYESSNVVQMVYGNCSPTSSSSWDDQVGINGNSTSDFNNRTTTTDWSATTAGTYNGATCTHSSTLVPASGLTFRWTPPPTIAVSPSTLSILQLVGTSSSGYSVALTGMGLTDDVTVTAPANFSVYNPTTSTWGSTVTVSNTSAAVGTYLNSSVLVRFDAPATAGTYTGSLSFSATGATAQNVSLTGNAVPACSGTPTAGTAAVTPTTGDGTTSFTLSLSGTTATGGLTYQWQSSSSPTSGFTDMTGATTSTYTFGGISANTYYQAIVTCPTYAPATSSTTVATWASTLAYSGSIGTYVVPAGVTALNILVKGAQGGACTSTWSGSSGGQGAIMSGNFCVTPGQVLKYIVGGQGVSANYVGGGGGGSYVWDSVTSQPLIVAGGGGGAGIYGAGPAGVNATTTINGTNGGGGTVDGGGVNGNGGTAPTGSSSGYGGGGAGWLTNGASGINYYGYANAGGGVRPLAGGAGGAWGGGSSSSVGAGGFGGGGGAQGMGSYTGAGGGGGYSGGGAGFYNDSWGGAEGGGGGGSYNIGAGQVNSVGNTGNGTIVFSIPTTTSASTSVSSLSFPITSVSTSSTPQNFGLIIVNATTSSSVVVTPPTGFEVSVDGGTTWSSTSASFTPSGCVNATIKVRFSPTATTSYSGNVTIDGGGIPSTLNVAVTGTGVSPCSGTPTPGTATATPATGNASTTIALSATGYTIAGGITFQWQSSPDGTTWTDIAGATNDNYSIGGITATTYYRLNVTCAGSSSTVPTSTVSVLYLPAACIPSSGSSSTYNRMDEFTLAGEAATSIDDYGPSSHPSNGYEDRTGAVAPISLMRTGSYSGDITYYSPGYTYESQIWIDFNDDGTFTSSEVVAPAFGTPGSYAYDAPFTLNIPATAPLGTHRMRVRMAYMSWSYSLSSYMDPCNSHDADYSHYYYGGTTRDYVANIVPLPPAVTSLPASIDFGPVTPSSSVVQIFTVTGTNMTSSPITVNTTSSNFEFSFDGTTWYSTAQSYPFTLPGFTNVPVYVRFTPSAVAPYTGNITITGGGLTATFNEPVSGNGATACSGAPTAGTASITPGVGGTSTPFTLSLTGSTAAGGLTYQWQSSTTSPTSGFTDISGATTLNYSFTGIGANTYYQAVVTCPSFGSATSNTVVATYSMTLTYTGAVGTYTVPAGATSMNITVMGAEGGTASYGGSGGHGAIITGNFCVTPGQVLKYIVGGKGQSATYVAGGGGGTYVWDAATNTPLIVAGGGGGGASWGTAEDGVDATTTINGTNGGGETPDGGGVNGNGGTAPSGSSSGYGGGGAGWLTNGADGINYSGYDNAGGGQKPLAGGAGGSWGGYSNAAVGSGGFGGGGGAQGMGSYTGAGGGGGYSGGGAGFYNDGYGGAEPGGGGGSYNSGAGQSSSVGNTGNGVVIFATPVGTSAATSVASLSFPLTNVSTTSAPMSFVLTIVNAVATSSVTVTPPASFEVSVDGGTTWSGTSASFTPVGCVSQTIQVRFAPTATTSYSGDVVITGGGIPSPVNVSVDGIGVLPCTGTPAPGATTITPTAGNGSTTFTLSSTGYTVAGSISFQWQSSTDGTTWSDISGATTTTYSFPGISATTYYRMNITCAPSSTTVASNIDTAIYIHGSCTPTFYSSPASDYRLDEFSLPGALSTSIDDYGPASHPNNGYENRVGIVPAITLMQNSVYPGTVTYDPSSSSYENQIWIDFNDNGSFETSEEVTPPFGDPSTTTSGASFNLTISPTATLGNHRMRIRTINIYWDYSLSTHIDPCYSYDSYSPWNSYYYGTTRDYVVNIVPLPDCSGTPDPGTVTTTATSGCGTISANLGLTGQTSGYGGLSYQWQSSPDNSVWSDISGATTTSVSVTTVTTTYYRMNMTCALSTLSAASATSMTLTVNPVPSAISGPSSMCTGGSTITLSDATAFGTWSSGNTAVATVDASGVVTAVSSGVVPISYTVTATGCYITTPIMVVGTPTASAITPSASQTVCLGNNATFTAASTVNDLTLLDQDFNSGLTGAVGGTWTINNLAGNSITYWSIRNPPGYVNTTIYGDGTPYMQAAPDGLNGLTSTNFVSPSFSTVGYATATLTYNQAFKSYYNDATVAVEYSTDGGSSWTTLVNQLGADYGGWGFSWSASSPDKTVTLPSDALGQSNVKLRWKYISTWGYYWEVDNIKVTGTPAVSYTWGPVASATGLGCTTCGTNTITPTVTGSNVYSVTASAAGCPSTPTNVTVIVNPLPAPLGGSALVCAGATTSLTESVAGGTWESDNTAVGTVGATTGIVSGVSAGTTNVSYTFTSTGCRVTKVVTVNAQPLAIGGSNTLCAGTTSTLTNAVTGGNWSSSNMPVATMDAGGVMSGVTSGFATITYQMPAGCYVTVPVTVNPVSIATVTPSAPAVCIGNSATVTVSAVPPTITLLAQDFNSGSLGSWNITNASGPGTSFWQIIDAGAGVFGSTGDGTKMLESNSSDAAAFGTNVSTILTSPSFSTIGYDSAKITFNQALYSFPSDAAVAVEYSTDGGTTWTGILDQIGAVDGSGSWTASAPEKSLSLPSAAMGVSNVMVRWNYNASSLYWDIDNIRISATQTPPTFTWTPVGAADGLGCTTCPGNTNTITPTVAGANVYSLTTTTTAGCSSYQTVTVTANPQPGVVSGTPTVCEGQTTTLTNPSSGGTWSSSAFGTATVDPTTGVVTGQSAGVATISYQLAGGCSSTMDVTVNTTPAAIGGNMAVCTGFTTSLTDVPAGGTWSSSDAAVATIGSATGLVSALATGNTTITYTLPGGCNVTGIVTVNLNPQPITGTLIVCQASTTSLSSLTGGGTWSSSDLFTASVDGSGVVSGINGGVATITYELPTTCKTTAEVSVNPQPAAISGTLSTCIGQTTTLTDVGGGTWSNDDVTVATINATTGVATGVAEGTTQVTYTIGTGCQITATLTVDPVPGTITGAPQACVGYTTALSHSVPSGTWSSAAPTIASVDATTGVVTGNVIGNADITYTLPTGCVTSVLVTVNPLPAPIAGPTQACEGSTTTFSDGSAGGTWMSNTPLVADFTSSSTLSAYASGTTIITYTLPTGCVRTRVFTVNVQPAAIDGTPQVCQTGTTTLSNMTPGGAWVSGVMPTATVTSTGVVSGLATGVAPVSYVMSTGCQSVVNVTVNAMPQPITGTANLCEGQSSTLASLPTGGSWWSGAAGIAAIDSTSGIATGAGVGTTTITYALPTGCLTTRDVVVNITPLPIAGTPEVCNGSTLTFTNPTTGGVWSSSNTAIANIGLYSGTATGMSAGTVNVSYTMLSGCAATTVLTVDAIPAPITGPLNVCNGQTTALATITSGGTWSSVNTSVATIGTGGSVTSVAAGTSTISYTLTSGCTRTAVVTVNALPAIDSVTGGGTYCTGGSGVHIGINASSLGVNYQLMSGATAVGTPTSGTGTTLDFGLITAGTYSVVASDASTGCASNMVGSATVTVSPLVTPTATLSLGASDTVCEGNTATITATTTDGGTAPTYAWQVNGITVPGATSSTYSFTPNNGDLVTMSVHSSNSCATPGTAIAMKTVAVSAKMMPVASAMATPGTILCDGNTVTFNAVATYGGSAPVFTWIVNSSIAATGTTYAYVPANGDIVYMILHSNYVCRLADSVQTPHVTMTTNPVYIPAVTISANPGFTNAPGTTVTLTANVSGGGATPTFQWYIGNVAISGASSSTFTNAGFSDGDSVSCQVTGSGACGLSAFNSVIMRYSGVGVASAANVSDVKLMPNPNKGEFIVKGALATKADREVNIEVTNMLGQIVFHGTTVAHGGNVDARIKLDNTLANGMYMLNLTAENEKQVFHFVLEQ